MNVLSSIATFYKEGGMFMHAVLVIAIVIIAIVVERMIVIGRASAGNARRLTDELVRAAARGDIAQMRNLSAGSDAPLAQVAHAMIQAAPADEATLQSAAEDATTLLIPDLTRRLSYLGALANSATLIGLLGTITGLITAISGVGVADAAQRSAYLAAGISEALHTTAFGLMVAIPTLLVQGWLNTRVEGIVTTLEHLAIRVGKALSRTDAGTPVARVAPRPQPAPTPVMHAPRAAAGGGQ